MLIQLAGFTAYCYHAGKPLDPVLPTLVFIHGAQNDHSVWGLQSRYFAFHGYNVLAVDLPGHGRSGGPALGSIEDNAAWLLSLLDTMKIDQASLIGHSMGSLIALDAARMRPAKVALLALLGTAYPMRVADSLLELARSDEAGAIRFVNSWSHARTTQSSFNPGTNLQGSATRLMQRMSARNPAQLFFTDFSACNQYRQGEQAAQILADQNRPVLFILGQSDRMTPVKASAALREKLPQAKVEILADCGHAMLGEQPDAVLNALVNFLR